MELGKDWLQYMVYTRQLVLGGEMSGESYPPLTCLSLAVKLWYLPSVLLYISLTMVKNRSICKHITFMNQGILMSCHLYMLTIVLCIFHIKYLYMYNTSNCFHIVTADKTKYSIYLPCTNTQNIKEWQTIIKKKIKTIDLVLLISIIKSEAFWSKFACSGIIK